MESAKGSTRVGSFLKGLSKDVDDIYRLKIKSNKSADPDFDKFELLKSVIAKEEEQLVAVTEISRKMIEKRSG